MSLHVKSIINSLTRNRVESLPRGELFIYRGFLDYFFGDHQGDYANQLEIAAQCLGISLIGVELDTEMSHSLLLKMGYQKLAEYFIVGCIDGPVAELIKTHGFFKAMLGMKKDPSLFPSVRTKLLREIDHKARKAHANGFKAIAIADDIAWNQGLFFSFDYFMEVVCPLYREIAGIVKGNGLFAFFHSDGDMRKAIRPLIEAGYDCLHPIDTQAGLNLYALRKEFGESVSFMGHIDPITWSEEQIQEEMMLAESEFKDGGLILGSTCGISVDTFNGKFGTLYPRWKKW